MKLYVYDHCPYCVKARMIFGLKHVDMELITLLNDDEDTPINMIGQKMVPILEKEDGTYMPESMDIVKYIDEMDGKPVLTGKTRQDISNWLDESRDIVYRLCMPRWTQAPLKEFETQGAIDYFTRKKEDMIGPFEENLAKTEELIKMIDAHLENLNGLIESEVAVNGVLSTDDIHLFATLRSLSIVKGIHYPEKVEAYRKKMAELSNVPLHDNIRI